jgi:hemolysin III
MPSTGTTPPPGVDEPAHVPRSSTSEQLLTDARDGVEDAAASAIRFVKPKLRGWLHAAVTPLGCAAGIVLVVLAPTSAGKVGGAVYLAATLLLFGTSALFHRYNWGATARGVLRRLDHANIYLFIAASYTPFALLLLDQRSMIWLLSVIWGAAVLGLLFRTVWLTAPRWLYTSLYVITGLAPAGWMPAFLHNSGPAVFTLILVGGGCYILGAVIYAIKRPDPWPRWFGFHELFHSCTIAAFVSHYIAISIITYTA